MSQRDECRWGVWFATHLEEWIEANCKGSEEETNNQGGELAQTVYSLGEVGHDIAPQQALTLFE